MRRASNKTHRTFGGRVTRRRNLRESQVCASSNKRYPFRASRNSSETVYPGRNYFTSSRGSRELSVLFCFFFYLREIEFYRYFDMWSPVARSRKGRFLYRQHRETISFPLFPAAFQQLILESLQVFHNSGGIFTPCLPLSADDISGILHISNCGFIMRKRRNVLMNCTTVELQ